jgi:hypothetical protein
LKEEGEAYVSTLRTRIEAKDWLDKRFAQEGPGLWTEQERRELADQVAQVYRPAAGGPKWRVKHWTQQPDGVSVYVVTRGGIVGIHTIDDREKASEKADAIMRTLNALDTEMKPSLDPAEGLI